MSGYIHQAVESFLDRTEGDGNVWPKKLSEEEDAGFQAEYGDPERGYQWYPLFLPNGTKIRMKYGGQQSYAEIRHERLQAGEEHMSPSRFASLVANNTSRNAWQDLYIKRPGDGSWQLADTLRRQMSPPDPLPLSAF